MKNKKEIFGWAMFDFANSIYTTNVVSFIFCNYFIQSIAPEGSGKTLWGVSQSISNLIIILSAPVIGAIADYSACRKSLLVTTCLLCVVTTAGLFFAEPGFVVMGMVLFVVSNYFFQISESICGSFLPDIAESQDMGKISGLGWSIGYFGGFFGLALCWNFMPADSNFGPENSWNLRLTNLITAGAFLVAATPTFLFLKERRIGTPLNSGLEYFTIGFRRVADTLTHIRKLKDLALFLGVFTLMSVGLTTVFSFFSNYSMEEMKFSGKNFVYLAMGLQFAAAAGAFGFGYVQDRYGIQKNIQFLLIAWVALLVGVYFATSKTFYVLLVVLLGAALGGVQPAARAMIGLFAPESKRAEIFGFWSLTYKLGGLLGPTMYGIVADGLSHRWAMLSVSIFFAFAFLLNRSVDDKRGIAAGIAFEKELAKANPS